MLSASFSLFGQSAISPYMQLFLNGETIPGDSRSNIPSKEADQKSLVSVFLTLEGEDAVEQLKEAGVKIGTVIGKLATARIPFDRIDDIAAMDCISYIEKASPVSTLLDEAKNETCISMIHSGENLPTAFLGKDVVIGVIDNGFEYGHPNFYNADKTHLRIKRVWDQNKSGISPESFSYGAEYTTEQEILAAAYDSEATSHGTHVVGIAAGSDNTDGHNYAGVAKEAEIVLVALNSEEMVYGNNATVIDGIKYIYDYAESVGKPCVVNLSLGSHFGPHDGTSAFDRMADAMQGPGKLLVGAVGNDGQNKFHLEARFEDNDGNDYKKIGTFVNFRYIYSEYSTIEMWADEGMTYDFIPFIYDIAGNRIEKVYDSVSLGTDIPTKGEYTFTLDDDKLTGSIKIISEINPDNKKGHAMAVFSFFKSDEYRIGFYIASKNKGSVHLWTDGTLSSFSNFGCDEFSDGDTNCTAGEIGGTGKRIVSVGAHVTRDHYTRFGIYYPSGEEIGHIASFSSYGPTADGRIKPDITAPGSYIVSSMSSVYTGQVAKAVSVMWNEKKYPFGFMQGTSMAAPLVSGTLACWLQAKPDLTPEEALEIIKKTAKTDSYTGTLPSTGNNIWGHGKIDALAGIKECIRLSGVSDISEDTMMPQIYQNDKSISMTFAQNGTDASAELFSVSGMKISYNKYSDIKSGMEYTIDTSDLPAGMYIIRLSQGENSTVKKILIRK